MPDCCLVRGVPLKSRRGKSRSPERTRNGGRNTSLPFSEFQPSLFGPAVFLVSLLTCCSNSPVSYSVGILAYVVLHSVSIDERLIPASLAASQPARATHELLDVSWMSRTSRRKSTSAGSTEPGSSPSRVYSTAANRSSGVTESTNAVNSSITFSTSRRSAISTTECM